MNPPCLKINYKLNINDEGLMIIKQYSPLNGLYFLPRNNLHSAFNPLT